MFSCPARRSGDTNLEHVLIKHVLILLAELLQNDLAELREVDVAVPHDVVGQVDDLLLHGVQTQHLHRG